MTENTTTTGERQYSKRNEALQQTIDALAQYDPATINEFGMKTQIAEEHRLEAHRVHYVLNNYPEAVQWRRTANADPLDPEAVKGAYEDDTLREMATAVPDGAGDVSVSVELTLDEAFRAIKLLPGDLGLKVYTQMLSEDFDRSVITEILDD